MSGGIWHYLSGGFRFSFAASQTVPVLNALRLKGIYYRNLLLRGERTELTVSLPRVRATRAIIAAADTGYKAEWLGLPGLLRRYRKRIGIPIGALLCCFLIGFSGQIIWCFEVSGNDTVSDGEIVEGLTALGCGLGARMSRLQMDDIENEFVLHSDRICWISVNLRGTTAHVQVRELETGSGTEDHTGQCANLVAREAGEIVYVEVSEGRGAVVAGDSVREGELLVAGVVDDKAGAVRYEYAAGKVMARVTRVIRVAISPHVEEKVYTGKETVCRAINIFGKTVNIFGNSGKSSPNCDMIVSSEKLSFFREAALPLVISTSVYKEYEMREKTLSEAEAVAMGMAELRERMDEALSDAELLRKTVSAGFSDGVYTVECRLYVLTDIAKVQEIPLSDLGEDYGTEGDQRP